MLHTIIAWILNNAVAALIIWLLSILGVSAIFELVILKKTRFWRNINRTVYFFCPGDTSRIEFVKDLVENNGLFTVYNKIINKTNYPEYLNSIHKKALYVVDYYKDGDNAFYQSIATDASSGNDNFPIIIYCPYPDWVTDAHKEIFSVQPYCDIVNTPIRLLSQLVSIYEIMPLKKMKPVKKTK